MCTNVNVSWVWALGLVCKRHTPFEMPNANANKYILGKSKRKSIEKNFFSSRRSTDIYCHSENIIQKKSLSHAVPGHVCVRSVCGKHVNKLISVFAKTCAISCRSPLFLCPFPVFRQVNYAFGHVFLPSPRRNVGMVGGIMLLRNLLSWCGERRKTRNRATVSGTREIEKEKNLLMWLERSLSPLHERRRRNEREKKRETRWAKHVFFGSNSRSNSLVFIQKLFKRMQDASNKCHNLSVNSKRPNCDIYTVHSSVIKAVKLNEKCLFLSIAKALQYLFTNCRKFPEK